MENPIKVGKTKDLLLVKLMNANSDNVALMHRELERNMQSSRALQLTYIEIKKRHYSPQQLKVLPSNQVMIYAALRKGMLSIDAHLVWLDEVEKLINKTFAN